jgi:hypothetical protein
MKNGYATTLLKSQLRLRWEMRTVLGAFSVRTAVLDAYGTFQSNRQIRSRCVVRTFAVALLYCPNDLAFRTANLAILLLYRETLILRVFPSNTDSAIDRISSVWSAALSWFLSRELDAETPSVPREASVLANDGVRMWHSQYSARID